MNINYKASPTVTLFHGDNAFFRGIMGPFGSGKSVGMCMEIMLKALAMPPGRGGKRRSKWAVVRNHYRELTDSTVKTWLEWFPPNKFGQWHKNDLTHYVRFDDVELDVVFRALDKPEEISKLLSVEYTGAWFNEAREIPFAILDAMTGRVGRFPPPNEKIDYWSGIIADTNPPDTDHWWYKMGEEPETWLRRGNPDITDEELEAELKEFTDEYKFYRQPSALSKLAENLENLKPDYYKRLALGKTREWKKVYVHGDYGFIVDGKLVYPEYVDEFHCSDKIKPINGAEIIRGWDFGLTPACVFAQVTSNGQLIVFDELISEEMGVDRFSDIVLQHSATKYPGFKFVDYGDPAGNQRAQTDEKTCFMILHGKQILIEAGKQDVTLRLESVKKALMSVVSGKPGFLIHPRCKSLRKGFMGGYQYKRMSTSGFEKYQDKPDKNAFSHPHDALQYICTQIHGIGLIDPGSQYEEEYDDPDDSPNNDGRSKRTGY
jgi:hypothetical protein